MKNFCFFFIHFISPRILFLNKLFKEIRKDKNAIFLGIFKVKNNMLFVDLHQYVDIYIIYFKDLENNCEIFIIKLKLDFTVT